MDVDLWRTPSLGDGDADNMLSDQRVFEKFYPASRHPSAQPVVIHFPQLPRRLRTRLDRLVKGYHTLVLGVWSFLLGPLPRPQRDSPTVVHILHQDK